MVSTTVKLIKSDVFDRWLKGVRNDRARARIEVRIERLGMGNAGDVKPVGGGVSEMRIDYGPGYRVYFTRRGPLVAVLLCGGAKSSQHDDIARARAIAAEFKQINITKFEE